MSAPIRSWELGTIVPPTCSLVVNTFANSESRWWTGSDEEIHVAMTLTGVIANTVGVVTMTIATISVVANMSGTEADPVMVSSSSTAVVAVVVGVLGAVGGLSSSTFTVVSSPGTDNVMVT